MIFLVGHRCVGKTLIAGILVKKFNLLHVETSEIVKSYKAATHPELPMNKWVEYVQAEHGINFIDQLIAEGIKSQVDATGKDGRLPIDVVITGNRAPIGVNYLREALQHTWFGVQNTLIVIKAEYAIMYRRLHDRNRDAVDAATTWEEFIKLVRSERENGLDALTSQADYIFENICESKEELEHSVEAFFRDTVSL